MFSFCNPFLLIFYLSLSVSLSGHEVIKMLTFIGIILLLMIIFGGKSEKSNSNFDEEDEMLEDLFFMDMMDHHK